MSAQIREERGEYYGILERTEKGTMDVTPWMEWFLGCLTRAIEGAQAAKRHPGARLYFDCGGVILSVIDPTKGGLTPTPGPKSLYFAVDDLDRVHKRAEALKALAPYKAHGEPASEPLKRPWGERSFYVVDPWGNDLCFVEEGTLYT